MKRKPSSLIIVAAVCVAAIPLWSVARSGRIRSAGVSGLERGSPKTGDIELSGELVPPITAFIDARDVELKIPTGTPVRRGDVIGIAIAADDSQEQAAAHQELEAARAAWRLARTQSRQTQAELAALDDEAAALQGQELQLQIAGSAADLQFASRLSGAAIEVDELEARVESQRGELRDASERLAATRATVDNTPAGPSTVAIVAPADGVLVAIEAPEGRKFGIASETAQLLVHALARPADLLRLRIGSAAAVIVQTVAARTLVAHVTDISTAPVDSSDGAVYQVTLAADNPGRIWLEGVPVLIRIPPPGR